MTLNVDAKVDMQVALTFSSISMLGFVYCTIILYVYSKREKIDMLSKKGTTVTFIFIGMLSQIASLVYDAQYKIVNFVWVCLILVLSMVVLVWGCSTFFRMRERQEELTAGMNNSSSLSVFIGIICAALTGLELLIFVGSVFDKNYLNCLLFGFGGLQKATQVWVYHFKLRHLKANEERLHGASWYCKLIALVNFVLWVESIEVTKEEQTKYMKNVLNDGYNIFAKAYTALIVDFRLICCILFIELAVAIDHQIKEKAETIHKNEDGENAVLPPQENNKIIVFTSFQELETFRMKRKQNFGLACVFGLMLLFSQILNTLQYRGNSGVGSWANMTVVLAIWLVVISAFILTKKIRKQTTFRKTTAMHDGIEYLMVLMGLVSVIFWIVKSVATSVWAYKAWNSNEREVHKMHEYLVWASFKSLQRPFSHLFLIYVFTNIDMTTIHNENIKKWTGAFFLVPFIMFSTLSLFFSLIADEYLFYVEQLVEQADFSTVLKVVYGTGSPMSLGFMLHIFVHFFIISGEMSKYVCVLEENANETLNGRTNQAIDENSDDKALMS